MGSQSKSPSVNEAHKYLAGAAVLFQSANKLWRQLKAENEVSLARSVLARLRSGEGLLDQIPLRSEN
jgi:hypothetical protein